MMNPIDPNDERIKRLVAALAGQGQGKPVFGGGHRVAGGGGGQRGLANYFRPGFAGINYNPLAAQMSQGARGILGLNSGHAPDSVAPPGPPGLDVAGQAPPVSLAPGTYASPQAGNEALGGVNVGGYSQNADGSYSAQTDVQADPYSVNNQNNSPDLEYANRARRLYQATSGRY